ncbi:ribonuclease HII [Thiocystis violascens]|uniref:Ribonuclease HII n=1 Tax=Thiocystis violascens (strain ATCC 17096 / DSM 198 / 6111) TaxID=765911 RepID=I3YCF9_THIV6|nr:ribonuclease HII [Thiocystis violascens]AFL74677.1 ribonuclease HII [Thiocystis violascens DSM 198]
MSEAVILVAGVDEAGRGPLAGPVSAAAVILDPARPIDGIADSKKLSAPRRAILDREIRARALAWAVAWATVEEIDRINILQASLLAMQRAVAALAIRPQRVLVDGNRCPEFGLEAQAIIGGDGLIPAIGAASILAKVARDRLMEQMDLDFPGYGFATHKGYPTRVHLAALRTLGVCPHHRRSFGPVRTLIESN